MAPHEQVMKQGRKGKRHTFLYPPHTTIVNAPLDRVFRGWHRCYHGGLHVWKHKTKVLRVAKRGKIVKTIYKPNLGKKPTKKAFAEIVVPAWKEWTGTHDITKAAARCGITADGIKFSNIHKKVFIKNAAQKAHRAQQLAVEQELADHTIPAGPTDGGRVASLQWQVQHAQKIIDALRDTTPTLAQAGLLRIDDTTVEAMEAEEIRRSKGPKRMKITQYYGSLEGKGAVNAVLQVFVIHNSHIPTSLCLFVCLSVCLFICLYFILYVCLFVCLSVRLLLCRCTVLC